MRKVLRLNWLALRALAAALLLSSPARIDAAKPAKPTADAGGCARVHKALENVLTTPAHVYTRETSSRRGTTVTETIYLDGKVYVLTNARWTLSPDSAVDMVKAQRKSREHATLSCERVGAETLEDRATGVYTTVRSTSDSRVESKLWIDEASGLLLKQEEDLTATGDPSNVVHRTTRYEYGNVKAPKLPE